MQKVNEEMLKNFEGRLREDEKSASTIQKYVADVRQFIDYAGEGRLITKDLLITYKEHLSEKYEISSVNSKLAAVNCFLRSVGLGECTVKSYKIQRDAFRSSERELTKDEYTRLLRTAKQKGDLRLYMIMMTICATGIRISELKFITVESLETQLARVSMKGKTRSVILPERLCVELKKFCRSEKLTSGSIFVTKSGKPMDRSNILHSMKKLCADANVPKSKVFPHNLRHLFAVTYYNSEHDICHLADLLGHSNINTTRIYTSVSYEEEERQIGNLGLF